MNHSTSPPPPACPGHHNFSTFHSDLWPICVQYGWLSDLLEMQTPLFLLKITWWFPSILKIKTEPVTIVTSPAPLPAQDPTSLHLSPQCPSSCLCLRSHTGLVGFESSVLPLFTTVVHAVSSAQNSLPFLFTWFAAPYHFLREAETGKFRPGQTPLRAMGHYSEIPQLQGIYVCDHKINGPFIWINKKQILS